MRVLTEELTARLASRELALAAAREAFLGAAEAVHPPVIVGFVPNGSERFTIKSGASASSVGAKVGCFWPDNPARGLPRHSSCVIMLDPETGRVAAVVEAASANALRTAAADALAVETLARTDARTLSILGAGNRAYFDAMAVTAVRSFTQLLIAARSREAAERLADRLARDTGIASRAVDVEQACRKADVLITATSASEPLFDADWVGAGTHISAMGADGPGKQEIPAEIYKRARLFCDISTQSRSIGEFQHAPASKPVVELGLVLHGRQVGRRAEDEITIFDSSGFALQDLELAKALLAAADERGEAP